MRRVIAIGLVGLMVGCGGRSWPVVRATADREFKQGRLPVRTIDVLPFDVSVTRHPDASHDQVRVAVNMRGAAEGALFAGLAKRGYRAAPVQGLSEAEVEGTLDSLSTYGHAQAQQGEGSLLVPFLPTPLGAASGADATLYVGGWAYLGKDPPAGGRGRKVAKWVIIGAVVVVAVVVIAVLAQKGGGGGGGNAVSAVGQGIARGATSAAKIAARTSFRVARLAGRVASATLDGLGRSHTHLHFCTSNDPAGCQPMVSGWHPYHSATVTYEQEHEKMPPSVMELEMTLVDNRSGRVLWHGRQRFKATAARSSDVKEVVKRMLAALPAAER